MAMTLIGIYFAWWWGGVAYAVCIWRRDFDLSLADLVFTIMFATFMGPLGGAIWQFCQWHDDYRRRHPKKQKTYVYKAPRKPIVLLKQQEGGCFPERAGYQQSKETP